MVNVWIKLNVNLSGSIGDSSYKEVLVNMDTVKTVSPKENTNEDGHSKLSFVSGETKMVKESLTKIEAMLAGNLDTGYKAPEPKAP